MKWRSLIDYLLYSHLFIATCALLMTMQTLLLLNIPFSNSHNLLAFIFISTLLLYTVHRLVSLEKVIAMDPDGRFKKINILRPYLLVQAFVASLIALYLFIQLKFNTQLGLVVPALLSIAYVLPIMNGFSTRLRDLNYIKIFLISIVWAFITVVLPLLELDFKINGITILSFIERAFFILIITIPFDVRDKSIDEAVAVKTLVSGKTQQEVMTLSGGILVSWILLCWIIYPFNMQFVFWIIGGLALLLTHKSFEQEQDYYFSGLVDGLMILLFMLLYLVK